MGTDKNLQPDLPNGVLDLLILRALVSGQRHGYGIAQHIRDCSGDVLDLGESSLYTSLQRLLLNGWVTGEWGTSENNRRARFYTLTRTGRKQLEQQTRHFEKVLGAIQQVLRTA